MPASQIPVEGYPLQPDQLILPSSPAPVEVDDPAPEPMEIESLENSPGNTLRTARRGKPEVTMLTASPGARRRVDSVPVNGHAAADDREPGLSRPTSPFDRPSSRNTVEITLTGRSRSRQDLCPDRPRHKYEHAV